MTTTMSSSRKGGADAAAGGSGNQGGFWRKNSSAIPGRPNPSAGNIVDLRQNSAKSGTSNINGAENSTSLKLSKSGGMSETSTFKDFEQSVSDAWDIQDLKGDPSTRPKTAEMVEIHQPSNKPSAAHSNFNFSFFCFQFYKIFSSTYKLRITYIIKCIILKYLRTWFVSLKRCFTL